MPLVTLFSPKTSLLAARRRLAALNAESGLENPQDCTAHCLKSACITLFSRKPTFMSLCQL
jgi:hypothetical protein